jgi:hypothetical protein
MIFKPVLLHFKFDNFLDLPSGVDEPVYSEFQTDLNGHKWCLLLYPGGTSKAIELGYIAVYLIRFFQGEMTNASGRTVRVNKNCQHKVACAFNWGEAQIVKREDVLDPSSNILKDGAICIDAGIQVKDRDDDMYQPRNLFCKRMLNLLNSGEKADVSFDVSGTIFLAHLAIIHANAPILANYGSGYNSFDENKSNVSEIIRDISADVFKLLLEHIYIGQGVPLKCALKHGKELINAANKYELVELKMAVKNALVQERILTKENVTDYILFADAQSCPLLKEYATYYFILHCNEVLRSEHSIRLRESGDLLSEIILQMAGGNEEEMSVTMPRKELDKFGLDADGSKDALISRLKGVQVAIHRLNLETISRCIKM